MGTYLARYFTTWEYVVGGVLEELMSDEWMMSAFVVDNNLVPRECTFWTNC